MADDSAADKPNVLSAPLIFGTRIALRYPVLTICLAVALTAASTWLSITKLGYKTSRADLINPNNDHNRLWVEYINEFGDEDDAVVVVEGTSREEVVPVLEEISQALEREDRLFSAVLHGVDLQKIRGKGLHYLPEADLTGVEQFIGQLSPIIEGQWAQLKLQNLLGGMCLRIEQAAVAAPAQLPNLLPQLERLSDSLSATLNQRRGYHSPWPGMPASFATLSELSSEYLLTNEGRMGFVLLRLVNRDEDGFTRGTEAVDTLRQLVAQIRAKHPTTKVGLTGLPILENDEMRSSQESMTWASIISFFGVALLFIAGFGGLRHAVLANVVLLMGMAWSFGYVTLSVGHLNILSVSFTVTLIGIGIDYGVHYVARYLQMRERYRSTPEALLRTTHSVGPAILTGALTTSVAFFAAGFTHFTGVAELGIIAGGGILICCAAELLVLPACISLIDRSGWGVEMPKPLDVHTWIEPLLKNPRRLLFSTGLFTAVVGLGIGSLWYDHNLLNLQAQGLESVELERRLLEESNQSVWYAVSMADSREELLARKEALLKHDSVERVEEIVSLLPTDIELKQPIIGRIQRQLQGLPERPPQLPSGTADEIGRALAHAQQVAQAHHLTRCERQFEQARDTLRRHNVRECEELVSIFQQQMAGDLLSRLYVLKSMSNPEPPRLSDLPSSLVSRFVSQHDRFLLKIFGRGNIWDMAALSRFVSDVRSVDPRATGNPLQAYEASLDMKTSYEQAAMYSLIVILGLLYLDFRNLYESMLATAPLALGVFQMFGLLGLIGIPLNPANMIALPLILGIGIDYGVHIVHDWREQKGRFRMTPSTCVAVVVDGLTTIVGFGALMIADHQGIQSLGRVLTIGISCCMFTSLVMLPGLLRLMTWHLPEVVDEPAVNENASSTQRDHTLLPDEPRPLRSHIAQRETVSGAAR